MPPTENALPKTSALPPLPAKLEPEKTLPPAPPRACTFTVILPLSVRSPLALPMPPSAPNKGLLPPEPAVALTLMVLKEGLIAARLSKIL